MIDTLIPYPRVSRLLLNYMYILDRDSNNNLWLSSYDNQIIQFNCASRLMNLRQQENNNMDGNTVTSSPIINDNIWMGTDNGISAFNIKHYSVKQFTYADGLALGCHYYNRAGGVFMIKNPIDFMSGQNIASFLLFPMFPFRANSAHAYLLKK